PPSPSSTLFPYTTLFRSSAPWTTALAQAWPSARPAKPPTFRTTPPKEPSKTLCTSPPTPVLQEKVVQDFRFQMRNTTRSTTAIIDRKSTRLNSSHLGISY